jgi:hypothetical protein
MEKLSAGKFHDVSLNAAGAEISRRQYLDFRTWRSGLRRLIFQINKGTSVLRQTV